jgi:hypothetical protein
MAKLRAAIPSFVGGELTPRLYGRTDLAFTRVGARTMRNMVPLVHGPAERAPGTRFVAQAKAAAVRGRLLPFTFNQEQTYVLELGALVARFYKDKAQIVSGGLPYELTTPWTAAQLADLQWTQSADVLTVTGPAHPPQNVTRTGHAAWTTADFGFEDGPYLDENATTTTLGLSATSGSVTVTASAATGINGGQGFLTTDVGRLIRWHDGAAWFWLTITAWTSSTQVTATVMASATTAATTATVRWQLGVYSDTTGWPRCVVYHEERIWFAGSTSYPNRIDGSKVADFTNFTPGADADAAIAITIAGNEVAAVRWLASSTVLLAGTLGPVYRIGSDSLNTPLTPSNVQAKETSAVASAAQQPVRAWNAVLFQDRYRRRLLATAYALEVEGWRADEASLRFEHLLQGGLGEMAWQGEPYSCLWAVRTDGGLVGLTYRPDQEVLAGHRHDIAGTRAAIESVATIAGAAGDELWRLVRRTVNGAVARHIEVTEPRFLDHADQEDAWLVQAGLELDQRSLPDATLTLDALSGSAVIATATGTYSFTAADDGKQVAIKGADGSIAQLGTITGVLGASEIRLNVPAATAFASLVLAAGDWELRALATSVSGLNHLEGQTVAIWADGAAQTPRVVASGAVTVSPPAARVIVGLAYTSELEPMTIEVGGEQGVSLGDTRRVVGLALRVLRSANPETGDGDAMTEALLGDPAATMDVAAPLQTKLHVAAFDGGWGLEERIVVRQAGPGPLTVVSLHPELETHGG